jgi:hypothetical protein
MSHDPSGDEVSLQPDANFWEVRFRGRYAGGPVLRELAGLLPPGLTLYLEGTSIAAVVQAFLARRADPHPASVERGVIWPRPKVFHMPLTVENLAGLVELMEHHAEPEIADHLHVYVGTVAYLIWYDAWFDSPLYIRNVVPEEGVRRVCDEFGGEFRRFAG